MKQTTIIEIQALPNGAHRNQTVFGEVALPEGWAVLAEGLEKPTSWPFVDPIVEDVTYYKTVTYLRDKIFIDDNGEKQHAIEEVTEEVPHTMKTVTDMTELERPEPEESETVKEPTTGEVLDALLGVDE